MHRVPGATGLRARIERGASLPVAVHLPQMDNSDGANFAAQNIPAVRLAAVDAPLSNLRHVLTAADTRDNVGVGKLRMAALVSAALAWDALTADGALLEGLRNVEAGG